MENLLKGVINGREFPKKVLSGWFLSGGRGCETLGYGGEGESVAREPGELLCLRNVRSGHGTRSITH